MTFLIILLWVIGGVGVLFLLGWLLIRWIEDREAGAGIIFMTIAILCIASFIYAVLQPEPPLTGYVASKQFHPAHTRTILVGKTPVPQFVPDEWVVTVKQGDEERACSMPEDYWDHVEVGQEFTCP